MELMSPLRTFSASCVFTPSHVFPNAIQSYGLHVFQNGRLVAETKSAANIFVLLF